MTITNINNYIIMSIIYKNTGSSRATKLTIHRKVDGIDITGYPVTFDLLSALPGNSNYPAITAADMRKLTDAEYTSRRSAFITMAANQTGYTADITGSVVTDTVTCPVMYVTP